jgi:methanogenic corrinoid protein MtbC1
VRERPSPATPEFFRHELLVASVDYVPAGVRDRLDHAVRTLGLGACLDNVLFPALREIGLRWQLGRFDIEAERLATEAMRGWLEGLALSAPEPDGSAPLVLTCGPADLHSIGLEALGVLLRHHGRDCRMLGARVPVRALTIAVKANRPSGVVVVSHLRTNRLSATQALRAAAALGPEVFYAGGAFSTARLRRNVPGTHLDANLQSACAVILGTTVPG